MKFRMIPFFLAVMVAANISYAHVQLDYPAGGEHFFTGQKIEIKWTLQIPHDQRDWDLFFSADSGVTWQTIKSDIPVEQLSYEWIVPDMITEHARIRIVQDNGSFDYEDMCSDFSIVEKVTSVSGDPESPYSFMLHGNYPNPFNASTVISYELAAPGPVELVIYNLLGQQVRKLLQTYQDASQHEVVWDGRNDRGEEAVSGAYLYRLQVGSQLLTGRMVLLR